MTGGIGGGAVAGEEELDLRNLGIDSLDLSLENDEAGMAGIGGTVCGALGSRVMVFETVGGAIEVGVVVPGADGSETVASGEASLSDRYDELAFGLGDPHDDTDTFDLRCFLILLHWLDVRSNTGVS